MKALKPLAAIAFSIVLWVGCSEKTKQDAKDAVKGAAEDTKENAEKVGDAVKAGVDEFKKPDEPATATDADADGVPNAADPQPADPQP